MKDKKINIVIAVLVIIAALLGWQLNNANKMNTSKEMRMASILFNCMTDLSTDLYLISETLDIYEEDFTPEERMLFENSLEGEMKLLNGLGHNLSHLKVGDFNWRIEVYEENIFWIELLLKNIKDRKIEDEELVEDISLIIRQGSEALLDTFFIDPVGVDGLSEDEVQKRIVGVLEAMNEEIDGLGINQE
jgi:hypothetical protein